MAQVTQETLRKALAGDVPLNEVFGLSEEQTGSIAILGLNLYQQGKIAEARTLFEGLIALNPNLFTGYAGLGAIALAAEPPRLDEAVQHLTKAIAINPNDPSVQANLGEALLRQGKFEDAAAAFEKALALDPDEADAGANRARAIIDGMEVVINEVQKLGVTE